jgi:hypothetical protein
MPAGVLSARSWRNSDILKPKLFMPRTKDAKVRKRLKQEDILRDWKIVNHCELRAKSISAAYPA